MWVTERSLRTDVREAGFWTTSHWHATDRDAAALWSSHRWRLQFELRGNALASETNKSTPHAGVASSSPEISEDSLRAWLFSPTVSSSPRRSTCWLGRWRSARWPML